MHLTFKHDALAVLLADAEVKWPNGTRSVYGQEDNPPRGFWIVGDQGVYLMHNGKHAAGADETKNVVVYAHECNPNTMDFDEWWAVKRLTFGGDDGADYFDTAFVLQCIELKRDMVIKFTRDSMVFEMGPMNEVKA